MSTIPKAGIVKQEDNTDFMSNSRTYIPSSSDRSDNETTGMFLAAESLQMHKKESLLTILYR